jgi:hypothetical protein
MKASLTSSMIAATYAIAATLPANAAITVTSDPILFWNQVALINVPGSPPQTTRGIAMVNVAMHDAVSRTYNQPKFYNAGVSAPGGNARAAASVAAHDVLVALNPANAAIYDAALSESLALVGNGTAKTNGITTGAAFAAATILARTGDGSSAVVPYVPSGLPGRWKPTPPANAPAALPQWGGVDPFLMSSGDQFRPGPPPALSSAEYAAAYNEVKVVGSATATLGERSADQTASAVFWAAAGGTTWLRVALDEGDTAGLSTLENARLFARLMTAAADTQIAGFDAKYFYDHWRPVTAIREGDTDGNDATVADATWTPLNAAPAHPSYVSTLSSVSAASAEILADAFGDAQNFCLTISGNSRCWTSYSEAVLDASNSRLWGGIHWRFDNEAGREMGRQIGLLALAADVFAPVPEPASWTLMIAGFAIAGMAVRRSQKVRVNFA